MSLLLCRQEPVKNPYYFECLGVQLYSSQELCYVIYNHPLLVLDGFADENLISFIRSELDMEFLAGKLEKWKKSGEDEDELLFLILQECDYYGGAEVNRYRQQVASYRKMSPADFSKAKADYLFTRKQYGRCVAEYEHILEIAKEEKIKVEFLAKVWYNLGSSYARLFMATKAYQAYQKSYDCVKNPEVLKRICYLSIWNPSMPVSDRFQTMITQEMKQECEAEVKRAEKEAESAESLARLTGVFAKDPIKRLAGAGEMVQTWKQEYRNMI